jgi:very-short-patch-repair endonuclease
MVKDAERDARLQGLGWRTFRVASIEDLMALVEVLVLTDDKRIVT